jgi:hypothetical protein
MIQKTCFVIMGFGVKTDYRTGKEIDLDKTYNNIIKPVFEELGFLCFRADDIKHSGVIDVPMFENIIKADFVLADISTLNANAIYELGVRHAVKSYSTLIIAEKGLERPFDISHIVIDSYEHLGRAIDYDEVLRFRGLLKEKIEVLLKEPKVDSPLYTFFPNLNMPSFTEAEVKEIKKEIKEETSVSDLMAEAEEARKLKDYNTAINLLNKAKTIYPTNEFITQRLALITYKSEQPDRMTALHNANQILSQLKPDLTTDPETLGLSGAIYKRLYEVTGEKEHLNKSSWYYSRGFYIKQDYYNGINLAFLFNQKAVLEVDQFQAYSFYGQAKEIRKIVLSICNDLIAEKAFNARDDKEWVYYTIAECHLFLGEFDEENKNIELARKFEEGEFAYSSYLEQRKKLIPLIEEFKAKYLN